MTRLRLLAACAAAVTTTFGLLGTALAQNASAEDPLRHIPPHERPAYVQQMMERQAERRAAGLDAAVDVTGPVITGFNAGTTLNLTKPAAPFKVTVKATDDLSGVRNCEFHAYGPHGQIMYVTAQPGIPSVNFGVVGGLGPKVSRLHEPGVWKFKNGYCHDAAGNGAIIGEAALDALGNTDFTVVSAGYDLQKPTLTSGKMLVGAVSLSGHVAGTTQPPYVGARFEAADTGDSAVAGVSAVYARFCLVASPSTCIHIWGDMYAAGQGVAGVVAGTQVSVGSGNTPGEYPLHSVQVDDSAGNYRLYTSTLFGGTTNFTPMFGGVAPKIKLNP